MPLKGNSSKKIPKIQEKLKLVGYYLRPFFISCGNTRFYQNHCYFVADLSIFSRLFLWIKVNCFRVYIGGQVHFGTLRGWLYCKKYFLKTVCRLKTVCFIFKKLFENLLPFSKILRGALSTSYILNVKPYFILQTS